MEHEYSIELGLDDTSNDGYFEYLSVPFWGKCRVYISTKITTPKAGIKYFYLRNISVKRTSECFNPPQDQWKWQDTHHFNLFLEQKRKRTVEGHRVLKQDPANKGKSSLFQEGNAQKEKRFDCKYRDTLACPAVKWTGKGMKCSFANKPKGKTFKLFYVMYENDHTHQMMLPPTVAGDEGSELATNEKDNSNDIPQDVNENEEEEGEVADDNDVNQESIPEECDSNVIPDGENENEGAVGLVADDNNFNQELIHEENYSDTPNNDNKKQRMSDSFQDEEGNSELNVNNEMILDHQENPEQIIDPPEQYASYEEPITDTENDSYGRENEREKSHIPNIDLHNTSGSLLNASYQMEYDNGDTERIVEDSIMLYEQTDRFNIYTIKSETDNVYKIGGRIKSKERNGIICMGKTIPSGTNLGRYPGKFFTKAELVKNNYRSSDKAFEVGRDKELGKLDPGSQPDILQGYNFLSYINSAENDEEINVLPFRILNKGKVYIHFMATRDIVYEEEIKAFFGPRKTLLELNKPLINFYQILGKKWPLKVCAEIEKEYLSKNPSYEPLYLKYYEDEEDDMDQINQPSTSTSTFTDITPKIDKYRKYYLDEHGNRYIDIKTQSSNLASKYRKKKDIKEYRFRIKKSSIRDAGEGVFAHDKIKKGALFGPYPGNKMTPEEYDSLGYEDAGYDFDIPDTGYGPKVLVPEREFDSGDGQNWLLKINHHFKNIKRNIKAIFIPKKEDFYVHTIKPVLPGQELFMDYGSQYDSLLLNLAVEKEVHEKRAKRNVGIGN